MKLFLYTLSFLGLLNLHSHARSAPPNIVVMLADDHSALDMPAYGAADIPTPNLDKMAAAGMVFDCAFVNSPSCAPSRAALFTGLYPANNGAEPNHSRVHEHLKRLPAYLKELGYEVVSFGKVSHYAHVTDDGTLTPNDLIGSSDNDRVTFLIS